MVPFHHQGVGGQRKGWESNPHAGDGSTLAVWPGYRCRLPSVVPTCGQWSSGESNPNNRACKAQRRPVGNPMFAGRLAVTPVGLEPTVSRLSTGPVYPLRHGVIERRTVAGLGLEPNRRTYEAQPGNPPARNERPPRGVPGNQW